MDDYPIGLKRPRVMNSMITNPNSVEDVTVPNNWNQFPNANLNQFHPIKANGEDGNLLDFAEDVGQQQNFQPCLASTPIVSEQNNSQQRQQSANEMLSVGNGVYFVGMGMNVMQERKCGQAQAPVLKDVQICDPKEGWPGTGVITERVGTNM